MNPKRIWSQITLILLGILLLVLGVAVAAWRWAEAQLSRPYPFRAPPGGIEFEVPAGEPTSRTLRRLHAVGVLKHPNLAFLEQVYRLGNPPFQAGRYRFLPPLSTREILEQLRSGRVALQTVTIPEGLTFQETAALLARAGFQTEEALLAAFQDPALIRDLDPLATNLEGYLFPETYAFSPFSSPEEIASTLTREFRRRFDREVRPLFANDPPPPVREIVILASLVEKEARREEERPLIAAVYRNRIRRGMGLYADPTIIYGLKLRSQWDGNLRKEHLEADSPWNTYRRLGWPPGPIASPGLASLKAAARPAEVDYLYFVSRNDGTHVFSRTLREHSHHVARYQRRARAD
jgi:UPF0755 protein